MSSEKHPHGYPHNRIYQPGPPKPLPPSTIPSASTLRRRGKAAVARSRQKAAANGQIRAKFSAAKTGS